MPTPGFFCTQTTGIMENDGPEPGSQPVAVAEITATPAQAQQGKKQLSEAQKAGLAKAREKAREKKLAASKQKSDMEKADAEKEEDERKKAQAYIHSQIAEQSAAAKAALEQEEAKEKPISDDDMATPSDAMTDSSEEQATPSPSPIKPKRKGKKQIKRARVESPVSKSSSDDEDDRVKRADANHASLTRAAYEQQLAQYKSDIIYKQLFPYL